MSRICPITGTGNRTGNHVSHANNKAKRLFAVNLRFATFYSPTLNRDIHLRLSPKGIKTINKYGGFDGYLATMPKRRLTKELVKLQKELKKKQG